MRKFFYVLLWVDVVVGNVDNESKLATVSRCYSVATFRSSKLQQDIDFLLTLQKYVIAVLKASLAAHVHFQPNALSISLELLLVFVNAKKEFSIQNTLAILTTASMKISNTTVAFHMKKNLNPQLNHITWLLVLLFQQFQFLS